MKNILIVSATSKSNFSLGKKLDTLCKKLGMESKVISLEDYMLPLYTDEVYDLQKDNYITMIEKLTEYFIDAKGLIICGNKSIVLIWWLYINSSVSVRTKPIRTKNNVNWMGILRLAFTHAPDDAKKLMKKIDNEDNIVSELVKKLSE